VLDAAARIRRRDPWRPGYVFLACWFGVYLIAFSVARTKLPSYMTPAYPAVALATGCFVHHWVRRRAAAPAKSVADALVVTAAVGIGVAVGLPIAAWVMGLRREVWLGLVGVVPLVGGILALRQLRAQNPVAAARAFAGCAVVLVAAVFTVAVARIDRYQHSRGVLAAIEARSDAPRIASFNRLEPSWVFYSGQTIKDYKSTTDAVAFLSSSPDAFIITSDEKLRYIEPALPSGISVIGRVPYFGRKGELLVIGRQQGNGTVAQAK
jgi:4-amino-4-deoxy-L-arabinose transferase-like glycosyltransferase